MSHPSPFNQPYKNAFWQLHAERLITAEKPFLARGITVKRCPHCQLAQHYCICPWLKPFAAIDDEQKPSSIGVDFVLLMHRDEILKPTNTGRLIAEVLPENCWAFEWSRLEPDERLLALLADPHRQCAIVYPASEKRAALQWPQSSGAEPPSVAALDSGHKVNYSGHNANYSGHNANYSEHNAKRLTLIMLDGTWRQAARMINHSRWLDYVPAFPIETTLQADYAMRKASDASRLSTMEAAIASAQQLGRCALAEHMRHVFSVFNGHYHATRACIPVTLSPSHDYLAACP